MSVSVHPTAARLIQTTSEMLDGSNPQHIRIDDVLAVSGVAKGSLYHHFGDFPALLEATLVYRFGKFVDETIAIMDNYARAPASKEEFWERMHEVTLLTQDPERAHRRAERARAIGMAASSERFSKALAVEQDRLTETLATLVRDSQAKGWVNSALDPMAIAVFLQAYTLGRAVDDIASTPVDPEAWNSLIRAVVAPLS